MIQAFGALLRAHPDIAFFLALALGYALGRIRLGQFSLGAVTGVLLAGVLFGQFGVTVDGAVKQIFFLLFLFSVGYRTGPPFFRGILSDELSQACAPGRERPHPPWPRCRKSRKAACRRSAMACPKPWGMSCWHYGAP